MINDVETGSTPEYPDLQPHYYTAEPDRIYEESRSVVDDLEQWERVDGDEAARKIEAERETSLLGFIDDVTIRIEPVADGVARVHLRSRSRVGKADFGQNARNIREFLSALDDRLEAARVEPSEQQEGDGDGGGSEGPASEPEQD